VVGFVNFNGNLCNGRDRKNGRWAIVPETIGAGRRRDGDAIGYYEGVVALKLGHPEAAALRQAISGEG
jgi:hypothetical protein